jgi:hypothetical protein
LTTCRTYPEETEEDGSYEVVLEAQQGDEGGEEASVAHALEAVGEGVALVVTAILDPLVQLLVLGGNVLLDGGLGDGVRLEIALNLVRDGPLGVLGGRQAAHKLSLRLGGRATDDTLPEGWLFGTSGGGSRSLRLDGGIAVLAAAF